MRTIRNTLKIALPLAGVVVIFAAILLVPPESVVTQILVSLVGILMIEAGVWNLTDNFLPSERKYDELRDEVERFIQGVRALNRAAVSARSFPGPRSWASYQAALDALHDSVDRMGGVAGKTSGGPPIEPPDDLSEAEGSEGRGEGAGSEGEGADSEAPERRAAVPRALEPSEGPAKA